MEQYQELTQKAIEGYESPLMVYIELKKAIDLLSKLQESIKMSAIQEAANEVEPFERFGAKVTYVSSAGSRWDFSQIQEWNELKQQREDIESKHKAAYYAWKKGSQYIDENGEVIPPAAYKEGNPTIQIKIK
jgi:uncharacterized protein Yka (UPF0111/DUF47 family)